MQKERLKNSKGITLIALVITIIVMLILVAVTVSVALKGELFGTAKDATKRTQIEVEREELSPSVLGAMGTDVKVSFTKLDSNLPKDWTGSNGIYTSPKGNKFIVDESGKIEFVESKYVKEIEGLAEGVTLVPNEELTGDIKTAAEIGKVKAVIKETINGTQTLAVVPTGFEISTEEGENSISGGLVITDGTNEFVWIPVTDSYTEDNLGPLTTKDDTSNCVYDSQEQLDYYYGEGYFNYEKDFNYAEDKTKIETSINKYKGFYVGRYETTIDENGSIGSKANTPVLTLEHTIKEGTNPNADSDWNSKYHYRWYGLYKVQKDMYAGSEAVFSTMITSKEWDKIMSFTGYGDAKRGPDTYTTKPDLSGSAYSTDSNKYDVSKNIYDLAGNVCEYTLVSRRSYRGGRLLPVRAIYQRPLRGAGNPTDRMNDER